MTAGVLLVGLGQIGLGYDLHLDADKHVYTHARAFSRHPAFQLVAGVDPDRDRRVSFEQAYKKPAYADVPMALAQHTADIAVAVIAGPTRAHCELVEQVLGSVTPRAILCEKPLADDLDDARAMVRHCAERGVQLYVNYMRRSDPAVIEVKRRLVSGEIASPLKGVAWYSKGFFHNGSHFFNLLQFWLGQMHAARVVDPGRLWNDSEPEPDVRVAFARGPVVFLAAREEDYSHYTIELVTPSGRLRYDQGGECVEWQAARPDPYFQGYTILSAEREVIPSGMDRYQWHVAEQLAAALDGRAFHLCDGTEALATLESMHSIMEQR